MLKHVDVVDVHLDHYPLQVRLRLEFFASISLSEATRNRCRVAPQAIFCLLRHTQEKIELTHHISQDIRISMMKSQMFKRNKFSPTKYHKTGHDDDLKDPLHVLHKISAFVVRQSNLKRVLLIPLGQIRWFKRNFACVAKVLNETCQINVYRITVYAMRYSQSTRAHRILWWEMSRNDDSFYQNGVEKSKLWSTPWLDLDAR